jgi:hypothetical protein
MRSRNSAHGRVGAAIAGAAIAMSALGAAGCGTSGGSKAPLYDEGPQGGAPVTCGGLVQSSAAPDSSGRFTVDGRLAECMPDGLWCPLRVSFGARCDGGTGYARCVAGAWRAECLEPSDAG